MTKQVKQLLQEAQASADKLFSISSVSAKNASLKGLFEGCSPFNVDINLQIPTPLKIKDLHIEYELARWLLSTKPQDIR